MNFRVLCNCDKTKARNGWLKTAHLTFETPVFMPVGTSGNVKAILQKDLEVMKASIILGNTYHLYLRPGLDILQAAGGLHKFMFWNNAILTDSGGFQIFSLAPLRKVSDEGVEFSSHIDGSLHMFTPEKVVDIQRIIGSDIMMCLDECMPYPVEKSDAEKSVKRTLDWERKCFEHFNSKEELYDYSQLIFSISQGSVFKDLRKKCIEELQRYDFDGNAIGGLAVGEEKELMYEITDFSTDLLEWKKPRYLMGVGTPADILECVERGVDMFDCVLPTRNARHGRLYTTYGEINLRAAKYKNEFNSPDEECSTYTSDNYSLAYLRHLFIANEILGQQLATIHNLGFYLKLMEDIRTSIKEKRFPEFKKNFTEKYNTIKNSEEQTD